MKRISQIPQSDHAKMVDRLTQLDTELEGIHTRTLHKKITIRRGDIRIAVSISRDRSQHGYYGSAHFYGKQHSSWGKLPSHAVARIIEQLNFTIARQVVDGNVAGRLAA